jgi:hypothetical protein
MEMKMREPAQASAGYAARARAEGTERVRVLEIELERALRLRFPHVLRRSSGEFEVDGAEIFVECGAGASFLRIRIPRSSAVAARWVPVEISRLHRRARVAVIAEAVDYLDDALAHRVA